MTKIYCRVTKCISNTGGLCTKDSIEVDENTHCWTVRTHEKVRYFGGRMG